MSWVKNIAAATSLAAAMSLAIGGTAAISGAIGHRIATIQADIDKQVMQEEHEWEVDLLSKNYMQHIRILEKKIEYYDKLVDLQFKN